MTGTYLAHKIKHVRCFYCERIVAPTDKAFITPISGLIECRECRDYRIGL